MVRYPPLLPLSSSPNDLDNKALSVSKSGLVLGSMDQQLFITLYNPLGQLSGGSIIYPSSICSRTSSDSYKKKQKIIIIIINIIIPTTVSWKILRG